MPIETEDQLARAKQALDLPGSPESKAKLQQLISGYESARKPGPSKFSNPLDAATLRLTEGLPTGRAAREQEEPATPLTALERSQAIGATDDHRLPKREDFSPEPATQEEKAALTKRDPYRKLRADAANIDVSKHEAPKPPEVESGVSLGRKYWIDPSFSEFMRIEGPHLQRELDPDTLRKLQALGPKAPEYRNWIDSLWNHRADLATSQGEALRRVPNSDTGETYAGKLGDIPAHLQDDVTATAAGAGNMLFPGGSTALASALGGTEAADAIKGSEGRHPLLAGVGGIAGAVNPRSLLSAPTRGAFRLLAGKSPGLLRATAAASGAGALGNVVGGAAQDLVESEARGIPMVDESGSPTNFDTGAAAERAKLGGLLGGGMHLLGGIPNQLTKSLSAGPLGPSLRGALSAGAIPKLTGGLSYEQDSPIPGLEQRRAAAGQENLASQATEEAAPKMAGAMERRNEGVKALAREETAKAYEGMPDREVPPEPPELLDRKKFMVGKPLDYEASPDAQEHAAIQAWAYQHDGAMRLTQQGLSVEEVAAELVKKEPRLPMAEALDRAETAKRLEPDLRRYVDREKRKLDTPLYRGLTLTPEQVEAARTKHTVDLGEPTSSFSISPTVGEDYARKTPNGLLVKTENTEAAPIWNHSWAPGEREALANKPGEFVISKRYRDPADPGVIYAEAEPKPPGWTPPTEKLKVSTTPIVEAAHELFTKNTNPETGGEVFGTPEDSALKREVARRLFATQVLPPGEAHSRAAAIGHTAKTFSISQAREAGIDVPPGTPESDVVLVRPTEYNAEQFDQMVQALDAKAKNDQRLKTGDKRWERLAQIAHETRGQFPGLNEMKAGQEQRFQENQRTIEQAGGTYGENKKVLPFEEQSATQQNTLRNRLQQVGQAPTAAERAHEVEVMKIAREAGIEKDLELIPQARSVDELLKAMGGNAGPTETVGGGGLSVRAHVTPAMRARAKLQAYPTLQALSSVAAPEKTFKVQIPPKVMDVLLEMRKGPGAPPPTVPGQRQVRLNSAIGLRGGLAGARLAGAAEQAGMRDEKRRVQSYQLTWEDLKNLFSMKQATTPQEATP